MTSCASWPRHRKSNASNSSSWSPVHWLPLNKRSGSWSSWPLGNQLLMRQGQRIQLFIQFIRRQARWTSQKSPFPSQNSQAASWPAFGRAESGQSLYLHEYGWPRVPQNLNARRPAWWYHGRLSACSCFESTAAAAIESRSRRSQLEICLTSAKIVV